MENLFADVILPYKKITIIQSGTAKVIPKFEIIARKN